MLKQRMLTAFIGGPLLLWAFIALPNAYYALLLALIVALAANEWVAMARLSNVFRVPFLFIFIVALYLCWQQLANNMEFVHFVLYVACGWWTLGFLILALYNRGNTQILFNPLVRIMLGFILLLPMFVALYFLRVYFGASLLVYLLFLIWIADSGAYFAGKRWGKHKLLPNVSPGKTWQGVMGAMVASLIYSLTYVFFSTSIIGNHYGLFILISFVTVVFSIHGDLVESMFKRQVGIKDSGQLLPGHGGMLDRIDSLTAAAPIFITGLLLLDGAA